MPDADDDLRSTLHPQSNPLVLPLPLSKSVKVHRDDGSTNNIRRNAGRVSRGRRRKMDSAPPAWKVATLSVLWRRLGVLAGAGATVGGFCWSDNSEVAAGWEGGVIVLSAKISALIEVIDMGAALTRGVGRLSSRVASRGVGSDSVDVPGRAKDRTEGSISRGLSDECSSEPIEGNGPPMRAEICLARASSEFKSFPSLTRRDGGSVMADELVDDCERIEVVSELVLLLEWSASRAGALSVLPARAGGIGFSRRFGEGG